MIATAGNTKLAALFLTNIQGVLDYWYDANPNSTASYHIDYARCRSRLLHEAVISGV